MIILFSFFISVFAAEQTFEDIAAQLRCPTCTGLSVLDSDAPFSVQIKNEVRNQMSQGKSEKEIIEFFQSRYGDWILRAPPKSGANLLVWLLPLLIALCGGIFIFIYFWRKEKSVSQNVGTRSRDDLYQQFLKDVQ